MEHREQKIDGFTKHPDGWCCSYMGRTIWCGGKGATKEQVERTYRRKCNEIDAGERRPVSGVRTFKMVLSDFLAAMEHRVRTRKPAPLSDRSLHNYAVELNRFGKFVGGSTPIEQVNRPEVFAEYARQFGGWKSSGFDSVVTRVGAMFNWAVEMEYIDRYRPGPGFQRPAKSELRDERIDLSKTYTPAEVAKLYLGANPAMRCLIGLGIGCAMNNAEVSNLARSCVDLNGGVVDFRRRKTGKARRVCPLPAEVVADLRKYDRREPLHAVDADLFFLTSHGSPYSATRKRDGKPSDSLSRLFRELESAVGVEHRPGRNFSGLRTTWYNLFQTMPRRGDYEQERRIIMGRAHGTVDLDSYLEDVGLDRLRHVSAHVWSFISSSLADAKAFPASPTASAPDASPPSARTLDSPELP